MSSIQNKIPIDINADNCLARVWTNDGLGAQCSSTRLPDNHDLDHNYYCEYHRKLFDIAGHNYPCHFNSSGQQEGIFYGHVTEPYPIFSPNGRLAINWKVREVQDRIDKAILEGKHWHNCSEVKKAERAKLAKDKNASRNSAEKDRIVKETDQLLIQKKKELQELDKLIVDRKQEITKLEENRDADIKILIHDINKNKYITLLDTIKQTNGYIKYNTVSIEGVQYNINVGSHEILDSSFQRCGKIINNTIYIKNNNNNTNYSKKMTCILDQIVYENKLYYTNKLTNILLNKDFEIIGRVSGDKLIVVNKNIGIKKTLHVTEIVHEGKRYLKQVDGKEIYDLEGNEIGYSLAGGQIIAMLKSQAK